MSSPARCWRHKAEDEGIAVAENIAGQTGIVNHDVIPNVVYTAPEIAGVASRGTGQGTRAQRQGRQVLDDGHSRAKANRDTDGFVKGLSLMRKPDRVLAVWIIASLAGTDDRGGLRRDGFGATSEDIAYTCTPTRPMPRR